MKFSKNWLREFVEPPVDIKTLTHQLTMAGLEVDSVEPAFSEFDGLFVCEIKSFKKHPHADRLHICEIDVDEKELVVVVCGAPNIKKGMRTVLAKVGATLPDKSKIELTEIKGVKSYGMLCSEYEIGLGEQNSGLIELSKHESIGTDLKKLIDLDDLIIDISLTPNRGDCLNLRGIAREVAALNEIPFVEKDYGSVKPKTNITRKINLLAEHSCPCYVGRIIENVDTTVASPLWLIEKLRCSGIRSINIIVDITNYVLLELGQPMHAFDNDKIKGEISVRYAKEGEVIQLLDKSRHKLEAETLLIADDSGPIAMAGIMGGYESSTTEKSKNIFLESAFFYPKAIIGKARHYGLHTESSHRFERGVDFKLQTTAIELATELVIKLCGGMAGAVTKLESFNNMPINPSFVLREAEIKRILGFGLDNAFVAKTFQALGIDCNYDDNKWYVTAPSYRFDMQIEVDLIEELARIYNYDNIPSSSLNTCLKLKKTNPHLSLIKQIKEILVNREYHEVITYSFVDPILNNLLKQQDHTMLLSNPISPELSEMRTSLWPGLLKTLMYNIKRQQDRVRLFESGLVFNVGDELRQDHHIGGVIYGDIYKKQWNRDKLPCSLYDIKLDVETILGLVADSKKINYKPSSKVILHAGQAVDVYVGKELVGSFGKISPIIQKQLDILGNIYLFELSNKILDKNKHINYKSISKFPTIKRDIAILVSKDVMVDDIVLEVKGKATEILTDLQLFDIYCGKGIEKGEKSLAFGLTFQDISSTLKDEEVDVIMKKIIKGLQINFSARFRG